MKQGRAGSNGPGGQKREPIPHAVSPRAVANIGLKSGNMTDCGPIPRVHSAPLYTGRGIEAPLKSHVTYPKGSQGRR